VAARRGSDAEIRSHCGDDVRRMNEVGGDLPFPHNEVAVLSTVALGPYSLELPDTSLGVRHDLGQVDSDGFVCTGFAH
jgi:hypothetical protein